MKYTWNDFLVDTWCEINGGGKVTQEQNRFMAAIKNNKELKAKFETPTLEQKAPECEHEWKIHHDGSAMCRRCGIWKRREL